MVVDYLQLQETLSAYYLGDFVVDPRVLDAAMGRRPDLDAEARDYGWEDTDVREVLLDTVAEVLGTAWPKYGDGIQVEAAFEAFAKAHARYVEGLN